MGLVSAGGTHILSGGEDKCVRRVIPCCDYIFRSVCVLYHQGKQVRHISDRSGVVEVKASFGKLCVRV